VEPGLAEKMMREIVYVVCGVINCLFMSAHFPLARQIARTQTIDAESRALLQAFNLAGILLLLFLSSAFLLASEDLVSRLGRMAILLGALLYLSRAVAEIVFFPKKNKAIAGAAVMLAAAHFLALL
jgi:hypothetical protein